MITTIKIPEKMNQDLAKIGEAEERSRNFLIRKAIEQFLKEVEDGKKSN